MFHNIFEHIQVCSILAWEGAQIQLKGLAAMFCARVFVCV